jgi:hypothetical protein
MRGSVARRLRQRYAGPGKFANPVRNTAKLRVRSVWRRVAGNVKKVCRCRCHHGGLDDELLFARSLGRSLTGRLRLTVQL